MGSLRQKNMQMAWMHRDLIVLSQVNDAGHDVFQFQKPDALKLDGPTEDLLEVSSQVEEPRVWATYIDIPVIPTSWLT